MLLDPDLEQCLLCLFEDNRLKLIRRYFTSRAQISQINPGAVTLFFPFTIRFRRPLRPTIPTIHHLPEARPPRESSWCKKLINDFHPVTRHECKEIHFCEIFNDIVHNNERKQLQLEHPRSHCYRILLIRKAYLLTYLLHGAESFLRS